MEIKLLHSNVSNGSLEEAKRLAGKMAGVCYLEDTMDAILAESEEKTLKRVQMLLNRKHHSPFEHPTFTFYLEGIPKILAMILNNENVYTTSEKSARYTKMEVYGLEAKFYQKWEEILKRKISEEYPTMAENKIQTLAQENARYGISVFSPATIMVHSINLRQLNYLLDYMEDYIKCCKESSFNYRLVPVLEEFCQKMEPWRIPELIEGKNHYLSLFAFRTRASQYGEVYSTNYKGTFAQLAQTLRHRTINYEILVPEYEVARFYVPRIIKANESLKSEWIEDMRAVAHLYPQGILVDINERGTLENFVRKCYERLCGCAQLEIAIQTKKTLLDYCEGMKITRPFIYRELYPLLKGPRCAFGYKCTSHCYCGPDGAFSRKI